MPEGCGRLSVAGRVERLCRKIFKIDGPYGPKGFLGLTAPLALRVVVAPYGRNIKSGLRGLLLCQQWYIT